MDRSTVLRGSSYFKLLYASTHLKLIFSLVISLTLSVPVYAQDGITLEGADSRRRPTFGTPSHYTICHYDQPLVYEQENNQCPAEFEDPWFGFLDICTWAAIQMQMFYEAIMDLFNADSNNIPCGANGELVELSFGPIYTYEGNWCEEPEDEEGYDWNIAQCDAEGSFTYCCQYEINRHEWL